MSTLDRTKLTERQLRLIRTTVGKDCTVQEFEVFIEAAERRRLDPFLGQIVPIIINRDDQERRRLKLLVTREGQRILAQRQGDYRLASKPARFRRSKDRITLDNPNGLISATVYLWKLGSNDGVWYPVSGYAHWDEFAPRPGGQSQVIYQSEIASLTRLVGPLHPAMSNKDGPWLRMPRLMLAKCAEMQALRAGWPDQYSGLHDEAEFDHDAAEDEAQQAVKADFSMHEQHSVMTETVTVYWSPTDVPEVLSTAAFLTRAPSHLQELPDVEVLQWVHLNRVALAKFGRAVLAKPWHLNNWSNAFLAKCHLHFTRLTLRGGVSGNCCSILRQRSTTALHH